MLKLYDHPFSPYAQKVKISLIEKGVAYETAMPAGIGAAVGAEPLWTNAYANRIATATASPTTSTVTGSPTRPRRSLLPRMPAAPSPPGRAPSARSSARPLPLAVAAAATPRRVTLIRPRATATPRAHPTDRYVDRTTRRSARRLRGGRPLSKPARMVGRR